MNAVAHNSVAMAPAYFLGATSRSPLTFTLTPGTHAHARQAQLMSTALVEPAATQKLLER